MTFFLQFRDAPSDSPLVEFQSPLPLPVPARGDTVKLFHPGATGEQLEGTVDRVQWGYQPQTKTQEGEDAVLFLQARVWLTPVTAGV